MDGVVWTREWLAGLTGREAEALLAELERDRRANEYQTLLLLAAVNRSGVFRDDGHASVGNWARAITHWSLPETNARVRAAKLLVEIDWADERASRGQFGQAQLGALGGLWREHALREHLPGAAEVLGWTAAELPFEDFAQVTKLWKAAADPDGAAARHDRAERGRDGWIQPLGAEFVFGGHMGTAQGEIVRAVWNAFTQVELVRDRDAVGEDGVLPRTAGQRRADALVAMAQAAAGDGAGVEVIVNYVIDSESYDAAVAKLSGEQPATASSPNAKWNHRCHTSGGVPVDAEQLIAASVVGFVRRAVVNAAGVTVDLGRRQRLFTGSARAAVMLNQVRCSWPGCSVPIERCQVDHAEEWSDGGVTDQANGNIDCGRHNRFKHDHGYRAVRDEHGVWRTLRPDGSIVGCPELEWSG